MWEITTMSTQESKTTRQFLNQRQQTDKAQHSQQAPRKSKQNKGKSPNIWYFIQGEVAYQS
jgi:hypothetical protein